MERAAGGFPVLMVDDDAQFLLSAGVALRSAGISPVATIEDSRQVIPFLEGREAAAVVIDLTMPHLSGRELLQKLKERYPELPVIVMTGRNEVEIAVECMRAGAFDYLVKPMEPARFVSCIRRAQEVRTLRAEVHSLKEHFLSGQLRNASAFREIVTQSRKMLAAFQYIEVVAPSRHPVLVTGETGTGEVEVHVADEGVGMTPDVLERISEPFFSTRLESGGLGLGLSICRSIVKGHRGTLAFESDVGKGTLAIVRLPVIGDAVTPGADVPTAPRMNVRG